MGETENKINTISKGLNILVEKLAKECYLEEMPAGGKVGSCGETWTIGPPLKSDTGGG